MEYIKRNLIVVLENYEYVNIKINNNYHNIAPAIFLTNFSTKNIDIGFKNERNSQFYKLIKIINESNVYELLDIVNFFKVYFYHIMNDKEIFNQPLHSHSKILLHIILNTDKEDILNHDDLINENIKIKNETQKLKSSLQLFIT